MRHWLQLATRNWSARPGRTAATVMAIALGVGTVVWITCCYESVRRTVQDWVLEWVGRSHLNIESPLGKWGHFSADVADAVRDDPAVAASTSRFWWRLHGAIDEQSAHVPPVDRYELDSTGIEPETEYVFRDMARNLISGRLIAPDDRGVVVVEDSVLRDKSLQLGDVLYLSAGDDSSIVRPFEIVGSIRRRRISQFQRPNVYIHIADMRDLLRFGERTTVVDLRLRDGSVDRLEQERLRILQAARRVDAAVSVSTAEAKLRQLNRAQGQMRLVLSLISGVAFLTSFFIILSTLSMGMVERIGQMGMMRCLGTTRAQLAAMVPAEVLPLGVAGVILGVPLGFALLAMTIRAVPDYVQQITVSRLGILLAVFGGIATALLGAMVPMFRAIGISPLAASRPESALHRGWFDWLAAGVGVVIIVAETIAIRSLSPDNERYVQYAVGSELVLYMGYALLAPLLVRLVGGPGVWGIARLLGLRWQLLRDQVSRAPWRGGMICSGLMVGLSLIVGLLVHGESVVQGWQFPREIPEAFIYSFRSSPLERLDAIRRTPGVRRVLAINEFSCRIDQARSGLYRLLQANQRFVCAELEEFPRIVRLEYLEGDEATALRQLAAGTHVLLTREYAQTFDRHVGDEITVEYRDRKATFTVAAVVASPAIDIAVSFFQAGGEFQFMAVGSIIGTMDQAREHFGREEFKLLIFDFDLPPQEVPEGFRLARAEQLGIPAAGPLADGDAETLESAWRRHREGDVFAAVLRHVDDPSSNYGSVSMLKTIIDRELRRLTRILTAIPTLALVIAALGVANLMMANVHARARQIAILRAVGATRWQLVRLVIGEAVILAVLGCALGLGLGFHLGAQSNFTTMRVTGMQISWAVPWDWVGYGAGLTLLMCLIAGIIPARYAARNNVIDAMQVT